LPAGLSSIIFKSKKEFGRLSGVVWGEGRIGREGRAGKGRGGFFGRVWDFGRGGQRDFEGNYNHTN